jgi:threonine/homoserine/homoserine lactone efflux protein
VIFSAVAIALVFCASPGAVNTESLRRGMDRGFWAALLVQIGSLTGDMIWAAIALTGTAFLVQHRPIALVLGVVGACFLLRQALAAFWGAARGTPASEADSALRGDFLTGAAFSLTNPFALAFWLGLGAGITATAHASFSTTLAFFGGFFAGAVIWCIAFPALIAVGRRHANAPIMRAIDALCGVALSYFGVRLLWQSLRALRVARILVG